MIFRVINSILVHKEILRYGENLGAMKEIKYTLLTEKQIQKTEQWIERLEIDKMDYNETVEELEQDWQQLVAQLKRDGIWEED